MKEPIRVLQFITPSGFYGAERWVLALARNIDPESVICDLAVTREGVGQDLTLADVYPVDHGRAVHYLDMKGRFDLRVIAELARVIRERKIGIIHTHGYKSDILGLLAARRTGIPCVSTPHGFSGKVGWKLGTFIKIGIYVLRHFDRVAPLSEELMSDMRRFRVPEENTRFIRNGVDLTEIDEAIGGFSSAKEEAGVHTLGFIGQMIPRKGLGDLLTVFDALYRRNPRLKLQLIGDGRERQVLESRAQALDSRDGIAFLGFRTDRLELLAGMDLFVMTSSLEGIPRCLMEAMAVGVPVVAYDIPGVNQLITHGETGMLAPYGDKVALERCCREVLEDQALSSSLINKGRRMIGEHYSAARMAREYENLFGELVEGITNPSTDSEQAG